MKRERDNRAREKKMFDKEAERTQTKEKNVYKEEKKDENHHSH